MANTRVLNTAVKTYNSYNVIITINGQIVSGAADDSFVTIEPKSDGVSSKTGCDGEVARAIDPNHQYQVRLVLLQTSSFNSKLQSYYNEDRMQGTGVFSIQVKDLAGNLEFFANQAWVMRQPSIVRGKDTNNLEWMIETGAISDSNIAL